MRKMRWVVVFLSFLAIAINYIDRANLAVAAPQIEKALGIGPADMGLLLSGFFWTYAFMQMPFGWFVDRIGARIALPIAVGWWSVFTAATATASSVVGMFGCRLLLGMGEAGAYPSCAKLVSQWFPREERAFATSIFDSGSRVGSALSIPVVALIVGTLGWRAAFVITGCLGILWIVGWFAIYRAGVHGAMMGESGGATAQQDGSGRRRGNGGVTWASLFRYRTLWGMMLGFFCLNFVIYFFITWFPSYLVQTRGFSLKSLGSLGMIPALISIPGGWLGGWASDTLVRRGWSLTAARKTCMVGGMLASSAITLSAFTSDTWLMLACFGLSYGSLAFAAASIWALPADVAPTPGHVASIGGIQNFASNIAGIVITTFTGAMVALTKGSFTIPLVVAGGFCVLGAFSYLVIVGRIEPLPVEPAQQGLAGTSHSSV
ncbi:MFS transporter [Paraburkholderia ferrariae]|uniref:MFS transporter n=1 Tax=Paraburkholderia ferrariae TaxID=386056 RepID=UPI000487671B|nr:MFS transporter [Paraburkholderia ferrariae]